MNISSLSKFLQLAAEDEPEDSSYIDSGWFDEQMNYHYYEEFDGWRSLLYPWEWAVHPEIVAYAQKLGLEIPDADFDISKTF